MGVVMVAEQGGMKRLAASHWLPDQAASIYVTFPQVSACLPQPTKILEHESCGSLLALQ